MARTILVIGTNDFIYKNLENFTKIKKLGFKVSNLTDNFFLKKNSHHLVSKIKKINPIFCIITAGISGGILFNIKNDLKILNYNCKIYQKIFNCLILAKIKNVFFISASCVYPKLINKKISESFFLTGALEETSLNYSISKILGHAYCNTAIKRNLNYICLVPATLYGPHYNNNEINSHVINSLISKFRNNKKIVKVWGDGSAKREFLHINDLLDAIFFIYKMKIKEKILNIGLNKDYSIRELVKFLKNLTKFKGKIVWKKNMPTGVRKKLLDSSKLYNLGWTPKYNLEHGLRSIIKE